MQHTPARRQIPLNACDSQIPMLITDYYFFSDWQMNLNVELQANFGNMIYAIMNYVSSLIPPVHNWYRRITVVYWRTPLVPVHYVASINLWQRSNKWKTIRCGKAKFSVLSAIQENAANLHCADSVPLTLAKMVGDKDVCPCQLTAVFKMVAICWVLHLWQAYNHIYTQL